MKKSTTQTFSQIEPSDHKTTPSEAKTVDRKAKRSRSPSSELSHTNKNVRQDHFQSDTKSIAQASNCPYKTTTHFSMPFSRELETVSEHDQSIHSEAMTDQESEVTTSAHLGSISIRSLTNSTHTINRESATTTSTLTPFSSHDGLGTSLFQEIQNNVARCLSERSINQQSHSESTSSVTVHTSGLETLPSMRAYLDHLEETYDQDLEEYGQFCDCTMQSDSEYEYDSDDEEVSRINTGQYFKK